MGIDSISANSGTAFLHRETRLRDQFLKSIQFCIRGGIRRQLHRAHHLGDNRVQRTIGVIRRALIAQTHVRGIVETVTEGLQQT